LVKEPIEKPNVQVSDTTDDATNAIVCHIIKSL